MGTIGSGNHCLDVFEDENGFIWVGVHCGSRGFGWTIASGFMALSQGAPWDKRVPEVECLIDLNTSLGDAYWNAMNLAGDYAYAGREWVVRHIVSLLGGNIEEIIHNHHNFCFKENHFGEEFIVVRKGSTPAFPGQLSFVGGSMGDNAVIVTGVDTETNAQLLRSTVHGAGRVMSRTQAAGKKDWKTGRKKSEGLISTQMMVDWLNDKKVTLVGGGLDEAPQAYRRLEYVLGAQGDSIKIVHQLRPHIVCMAGEKDFDPYKD
jgi:tRNA-splicing ligase RtcB